MNRFSLMLLLVAALVCLHSVSARRRSELEADESVKHEVSGRAQSGATISETVYDRIAASAKGQVQKKQINSKGSTIIVDNTNGLATVINSPDEVTELKKEAEASQQKTQADEEKEKHESEEQKKKDEQVAQAKKEKEEEGRKVDAQASASQVVASAKDREKRSSQKLTEKQSKEHTNKHFVDFSGLCTVASSCPPGWESKGLAGMIVHKKHQETNSFRKGEEFSTKWRWMHPFLCCATGKQSKINDLFVFHRTCPAGTRNVGMAGIIMVKKNYGKNPFHNGDNFNDYWRWSHPYACQTPNAKIVKASQSCLFAKQCPPRWSDHGFGGLLIHNNDFDKQPFHKGGKYNESWTWAHPRVCCLQA